MSSIFLSMPLSVRVENKNLILRYNTPELEETKIIALLPSQKAVTHIVIPMIGGFISHSAILWCYDHNISLTFLDKKRYPVQTFYPYASCYPSMKRMQASMTWEDTCPFVKEWIAKKVQGQLDNLIIFSDSLTHIRYIERPLRDKAMKEMEAAMRTMNTIQDEINLSESMDKDSLRGLEGQASQQYFSAIKELPVHFRKVKALPSEWVPIGPRNGLNGNSSRKALTPFHALLNYGYGMLSRRMLIALIGEHLDPDLGFFHSDHNQRENLVYDVIEPLRPLIDQWVWNMMIVQERKASDFLQNYEGHVTILTPALKLWQKEIDSILETPVKDTAKQLGKALRTRLTQSDSRAVDLS